MILISKTYWGGAPFRFASPPKEAEVESRVLKAEDFREFRALYWTPRGTPRPRVAVVAMHPRVDFTHHYTFPRLLAAGFGCLGANTRASGDDTDLVHEEAALDLAAAVRWLRERRGVERVVLLGNSGGGSLSALFQAQASLPPEERLEQTPAGAPARLRGATLIPADGLVLVAAHRGQGKVLGRAIDPSVTDERDPFSRDEGLDMYAPENGFRPPPEWSEYDDAFVARYRAAQDARVGRLDDAAREHVAAAREAADRAGAPGFDALPFAERQRIQQRQAFEPVMVVYRTMANLDYVDRHLDPSGRDYGSLLSERPDLMSYKALGFARTVTPRAWLSTWSARSSNADLVHNLAGVTVPTLVCHAGRDREIYPQTDQAPVNAALAAADRTVVDFPEARHYFEGDPGAKERPHTEALMDTVVPWIRERFA